MSSVQVHSQAGKHASPWTKADRVKMQLWGVAWALLCAWTPKPLYRWRNVVLRLFGAKLHGTPFVHQKARIQIPWNLELFDRASIGDRAVMYSLGPISVGKDAVVAQESYVCTGTHDFTQAHEPLVTAPILIAEGAFIGARAFIMPGITVGERAVVGAMSLVVKDVAPGTIVGGNPAKEIGRRGQPA